MPISNFPSAPDHAPPANQLLASLPPEEFERLRPHLSPLPLTLGHNLAQPGQELQNVYFVQEGMISYIVRLETGLAVEVGVVGTEGAVGVESVLAQEPNMFQITAQATGEALVLPADVFRSEMRRGDTLYLGAMRHLHRLTLQSSQSALCNRQHTTEERLSRWLLMMQDRVPKDELELKNSFLSMMLGSRESGVFYAANMLKKVGFIDFNSESIQILDRQGLEGMACECYAALRHTSSLASVAPSQTAALQAQE